MGKFPRWLTGNGEPDFLWLGSGFTDEGQITFVVQRKRRGHGVGERKVFARAGGRVVQQLAGETICGEKDQAAIFSPAVRQDGSVETDRGEILGGRRAYGKQPEIM